MYELPYRPSGSQSKIWFENSGEPFTLDPVIPDGDGLEHKTPQKRDPVLLEASWLWSSGATVEPLDFAYLASTKGLLFCQELFIGRPLLDSPGVLEL